MTNDQKFLKAAHIVPDDIRIPVWQEWRQEDVDFLRHQVIDYARHIEGQARHIGKLATKIRTLQLAAFAGWLFAGLLMLGGAVKRW